MKRILLRVQIRHALLTAILIISLVCSWVYVAFATAPNPGHNFTEVGGGAVQGDILYGSAADTLSALAKNTTASRYLSNTGASNNPAWAQVDLSNGITNTLGLGNGGTGQASAAAARGSSGLNIDQMTNVGDTNYTVLSTDRTVQTNAAFTAPRTWTLPAANAVNAGQSICFFDKQGTLTTVNTLTISRAGSDTINGGTSVVRNTAFMGFCLYSDGSSKWSMPIEGEASGGTGQTTYTTGDMLYANATNNLAKLADVAAGSYLRSGGVGTAPVWSTPTLPNTAGTNKVMVGNGTNWVESTPTFPNASATTRKIIVSDGTNWVASTETYATPGVDTNKLLSDGTNWVAAAGYVLINVQVKVNGNTSYTPTSGTNAVLIRMCGGGGGGGGATGASSNASVAGGGGSGGYLEKFVTFSTTAGSYTIAVGAVGAGGLAANGTGSTGGNTTFACDANCSSGAVTFTANGGLGGVPSGSGTTVVPSLGGAGGAVSTNGDVNAAGQPGYYALRLSGTAGVSGAGAASEFGGGGNARTTAGVGNAGGNFCAGGGGAVSFSTTGNAGGAGTAGIMTIWEFR